MLHLRIFLVGIFFSLFVFSSTKAIIEIVEYKKLFKDTRKKGKDNDKRRSN